MPESTTFPDRRLLPQHEAYLAARSVRVDIAEAAGVRSLVPSAVARVLGWNAAHCAGLLVPHCDHGGKVITPRIRLDAPSSGAKFQLPRGTVVAPWIPSGQVLELASLPRDVLRDPSVPLVVVEGPVKAMALLSVGILAIGLGGVSAGGHDADLNAKRKVLKAHPMLCERVVLKGRRVVVLFDAGIATNPAVADGAALNALAFEAEGAEVQFARLPPPNNGNDQGPDDYLTRHGASALESVIEQARTASPMRRAKEIVLGVVKDLHDAPKEERQRATTEAFLPFLEDMVVRAILRRSEPAMREAVALEVQRATSMSKRVVTQAVEAFEQALKGPRPQDIRRQRHEPDARPEIIVNADVHESTDAAIQALSRSDVVFCRSSSLCEILFDERSAVGRATADRVPVVRDLNTARIIDLLSAQARWVAPGENGLRPVRPPDHIARTVESRGRWPGIRRLDSIVDHPLLFADGRVLDRTGYDAGSALYLHLEGKFPSVPSSPSRAEAQLAIQRLLSVVTDFPFESDDDKAAWISSVATPVARHAFEGNAPLFATTGNTPGCGKGMLNEVTATIVTGRPMAIMAPVENRGNVTTSERVDDNEMRKRITAHVRSGTPLVLIDNAQVIGGNAINALLTCRGRWEDRILGQSAVVSMPMLSIWYATGNNLQLPRETRRRTVLIRLRSPLADPFRRTNFSLPNLIGWVHEHRQELLRDALLVLRAYIVAGRPNAGLDALGSFEEWSALVRNAIVWAGLPDPLNSLRGEVELDPETETLRSLLAGLEPLTRNGGVTSQRIIEAISYPPDPVSQAVPNPPLATAVGELVSGNRPTAAQLSNALRPLVGRVLDGRKLAAKRTSAGWTWSVLREDDGRDGNDGHRPSGPG